MKTYQIHLIRHAMTAGNLAGQYIGHTDMPACEEGLRQVRQMQEQFGYPEVQAVLSSPLKRCLQTAELAYPDKTPAVLDGLIEYNFGEFEGRTAEELMDDEDFTEWLAGTNPTKAVPFGDSYASFGRRISACFERIVDSIIAAGIDSTAVFTHGGVIMAIMEKYALPEAPMNEWLTPNGCGYTLRIDPWLWNRGKKLEAIDECPAMPLTADDTAGWDYYPDDDDFDITPYINED